MAIDRGQGIAISTELAESFDVQGLIDEAEAAKVAAQAAQTAAEVAETNAETAETNAETAEANASSSSSSANASASSASASATNASNAQTAAELAETNAETAQTAAELAETHAETAETNAETAETNAQSSENDAETAQTAAETAKTQAETAKTAAQSAKTSAETAETNALASKNAAAASQSSATASATSATASAASAGSSATDAQSSEDDAETSATASATSASASSSSASAASTSASTATTQAGIATTKASEASTSATNAATSLSTFQGQYVSQASNPSSPSAGDLWFDTTNHTMNVYDTVEGWLEIKKTVNGIQESSEHTATAGQDTFSADYDTGFVNVFLNGIRLNEEDYTATNGTSVVLDTSADAGDLIYILAFGTFQVVNHYTKTQADTLLDGKVDNSQVLTDVPTGAVFTDTNTTYTAGTNVSISGGNVISSTDTDTTYTAGTNVSISGGNVISSTDTNTTYSVGDGGLTEKNFTSADNTKLDGIATSANNYTHPATHPASMLTGALPAIDGSSLTGIEGVPSGIISMWSGAAAAIPSGWNLCDGTNSTPNLVGKFIKGGSTAGTTGGSNTHSHSHSLSAGSHTLSTAQMPSHDHNATLWRSQTITGNRLAGSAGTYDGTLQQIGTDTTSISNTGSSSSHSHSLSGSISSGSNEPAYYELCYIMKA